jgi:hypothetical protein
MSARGRYSAGPRCLRVVPRSRGGWTVMTEQEGVVSEHGTAIEAELAALARLGDDDQLVLYDCYHRSHRVRGGAAHRSDDGPPPDAPLALSRS